MNPPRPSRLRLLAILAVFSFLGPLLGYVALFAGVAITTSNFEALFVGIALAFVLVMPVLLLFALAGPPAVVTGLVAVLAVRDRNRFRFLAIMTLTGALFSFAAPFVLSPLMGLSHHPTPGKSELFNLFLILGLPGAVAALICALVALQIVGRPISLWELSQTALASRLTERLHASHVLLVVLGVIMIAMVATLLLPVLAR